jgi:4-hydroxyphenylpyruvate dioxygenase-like putative hemolysin
MSQPLFNDIVQIGVVVDNVDACVAKYRQLLDMQDWHVNYVDTAIGKGNNFCNGGKHIIAKAKIAWIIIGNVELELIEPRDEESVYAQFLHDKGPGIHHIMFATSDYEKCSATMAANNVGLLGSGELQQTRFQMFDTEKDLGLICEIAEGGALAPDETITP